MSNIELISNKVKAIYQNRNGTTKMDVPYFMFTHDWILKAEDYSRAASVLWQDWGQHVNAYIQVVGHSLELALKSYLVVNDNKVPGTHDLIQLCSKCEDAGFSFEDREIAYISHLHHHYYQDFATGTQFKARYPALTEGDGGTIGTYVDYEITINRLLDASRRELIKKEEAFVASKKSK